MIYKAQEFVNLKLRVKAEMLRRSLVGSLASYGGDEYDYIYAPSTNFPITTEHGYKIWYPMEQINSTGTKEPKQNNILENFEVLESFLSESELLPIGVKNNSNCRASCSGLCQNTCSGSCSGTCTNRCSEGCSSSCTNSCDGSCEGFCEGGCAGYCTRACGDSACGVICEGSCYQSAD